MAMEILIRFNHNGTNDAERWRLVWDGKEFICASIHLECGSETVKKAVIVKGEPTIKWHIQPISPSKLIFAYSENELNVTIL